MRHISAGAEEIFHLRRRVQVVGPSERDLRRQAVEVVRLQSCLKGVVVGESGRRDRVDLRQGGVFGVVGPGGLFARETRRIYASWPVAGAQRRLVDVQKLKLVNTVISNVANLKNKSLAQLLLNIQIPFLRIRRLQVALDARDVERRLRSACAEDRHTDAERNRSAGHNRETCSRTDRILREPFLEVIKRNGVVVNAKAGANDRLAAGDDRDRRSPCQRNTRAKIPLRSVVEMRSPDQTLTWIESREASARFVHRREEIVA